jgi:hypothetical protein
MYNSTLDVREELQMSKLLNVLNNTSLVAGAGSAGPGTYRSSVPRVALGFAGVAMTVITVAASVILPAQWGSASREPGQPFASQTTRPASNNVGAITSITVVAAREPRSSTAPRRIGEDAPPSGHLAETTSSAILRVSSAAQ